MVYVLAVNVLSKSWLMLFVKDAVCFSLTFVAGEKLKIVLSELVKEL